MFKFIRLLIWLGVLGAIVYFGATVHLGKYTLFGHLRRIWHSKETQDMVEGTKEKAGPALDRLKRGVKAGVDEVARDGGHDAGVPARR